MDALIQGGKIPYGKIRVSGAKNSATRLLSAALLTDYTVEIGSFPTKLVDVGHKISFCAKLGVSINVAVESETLQIDASTMRSSVLTRDDYDVPIRTTYLLAAGQLFRFGIARIPYPGGCPIGGGTGGGRGYDLHILVWKSLGCEVRELEDHIEITCKRLIGGRIDFPISTVGGTENALLCAAVALGRTEIYNAYVTPEVSDLIELLKRMGADIDVFGTSHIVVTGNGGPLSGARIDVMPDRIEALTWIVFGILSKGTLTIENVPLEAMEIPLLHIEHAGINLLRNKDTVHVSPDCLASGGVQPFELACGTHPGIISDMQSFYVMLALVASGTSRIFDYRYPERIAYAHELSRLINGSHIEAERGRILVRGPAEFIPGVANSTDLRGSMAAVMAALCADGESKIRNVQMALRGYNDLKRKLEDLGANIELLSASEAETDCRST